MKMMSEITKEKMIPNAKNKKIATQKFGMRSDHKIKFHELLTQKNQKIKKEVKVLWNKYFI